MKKALILFLLLIFLFPVVASAAVFDRDLYYGIQSDPDVTKLQEFLTDQNVYSGSITGNFFSLTLAGVRAFQQKENISPTAGYFGPLTRARANQLAGIEITASDEQSIAETGTTPPIPPPSTIQQQLDAVLQQVVLLQQQLASMQRLEAKVQEQTGIIQQQQQILQQIQQNTTPPASSSSSSSSSPASWGTNTFSSLFMDHPDPPRPLTISGGSGGFACGFYTGHYYGTSNPPACDVFSLTNTSNSNSNFVDWPVTISIRGGEGKIILKKAVIEIGGTIDIANDIDDIYVTHLRQDSYLNYVYGPIKESFTPSSLISLDKIYGLAVEGDLGGKIEIKVRIKPSADLKTITLKFKELAFNDINGNPIDISSFLPIPENVAKLAIDPR